MKILKFLSLAVFFTSLLGSFVNAQSTKVESAPSLTGMAVNEKFISPEAGFSIALPKEIVKRTPVTKEDEKGFEFTWALKEGNVILNYGEFTNGMKFDSDGLYNSFFKGFKEGLVEEGVKIVSETPYKATSYRSVNFVLEIKGVSTHMRVFAHSNTYYVITGVPDPSISGAEALLLKSLDSFTLTALAGKK